MKWCWPTSDRLFAHTVTLSAGWFEAARTGDVGTDHHRYQYCADGDDIDPLHGGRNLLLLVGGFYGGAVLSQNVACGLGGCAAGGFAACFHGRQLKDGITSGPRPAWRCWGRG